MSMTVENLLVRKSIVINAPQAHVFNVFVTHQDAWWPRTHHIGKTEKFVAHLEPFLGGRWYEQGDDGSQCEWGRVLAWEPHGRIVLSWDIDADFQYAPGIGMEVEVRFIVESPERTRVELEHRKLEVLGEKATGFHAAIDSEGGWIEILRQLGAETERRKAG